MRFSMNWLRQWVPTELGARDVADRLTAAGLEVDELVEVGADLAFGGSAPATVVCGAPNARAGLKAPLAVPGTRLPDGTVIRKAKLRGVESAGMLCSAPELGLSEDADGLLELPDSCRAGEALTEALGLPDHEIEIDLTPNRADCLSLRGIARELAAATGVACREPAIEPVAAESGREIAIELLDPADCPRYVGRVVEGIDPAAVTPAWMVERLERSGLRSRGPVVDATNYVMLELGQPMHAFDLERIAGGIRVRRARPGDSITLLDGQTLEPAADTLLICDHERPVALAGIMGGQDSAVGDATRDILLESAWFNPATIMGKGRRFGLSTDSSYRFERGVDPELQVRAIERATALIRSITGGRAGPVVERSAADSLPDAPEITLRLERVNRLLGTSLDAANVSGILESLDMRVEHGEQGFRVRPPTARRDLAQEVDLIEEVARIVGYDALPARAPGGRLVAAVDSERTAPLAQLRSALHARGFQEIMTWSFVAGDDLEILSQAEGAQPLANPLSQEMGSLRTTLLPGLLRTAAANLRRQSPRLKLFETGHVFLAGEDWSERERLGLLLAGRAQPESWHAQRREFDFFDLKGELEQLAAVSGHGAGALRLRAATRPWLHPGQAADVELNGKAVGHAGQLHPGVAAELDLDGRVFVAEVDLSALRTRALPCYRGVARYPSVRRDLALLVPEAVPAESLERAASEAAGEWLVECVIFDQYQGAEIESGYKSLAIGLILRDVSRTLTDSEVDSVMLRVVESLKQRCNVRQRG